jgi:hypothetical protein
VGSYVWPFLSKYAAAVFLMRSLSGFLRGHWHRSARQLLEWKYARGRSQMSLDRLGWQQSLSEPTAFYFECLRYFYQELPPDIRAHRLYFRKNRRGFGENPFHVMWFLLLREFKPSNFLEIGVFRGQTISLAALCARLLNLRCEVYGISPFSSAGDSVSRYRTDVDYFEDTLANFNHFGLVRPHLLRAYSTEDAAAELVSSKAWDMIYIDGNHDYEVARKDWELCSRHTKQGGLIVLDDAALTTPFHPPAYAGTRGHPGPSQLAQEIDRSRFQEILQVGHNRVFQKIG